MYAWSGQWRVFDQENRTEAAQRRHQKTSWRQNESESKRGQMQSKRHKRKHPYSFELWHLTVTIYLPVS